MTEKIPDVQPAVPVQAAPPVPAQNAQPIPPVVKPVGSSPDVKQVPLPALQEERAKRQEEHSRANTLEQEVAQLKRTVADQQIAQHQVPQQPQVDPRKELDQIWEDDPRKAVQVEIMYAMDWRDRIDSSLEAQADAMARKYPDFNNYRSTALGQVRSMPLNQRGGQGILEAAYFMVRGQNADTMIQQREAELLEKYRRGEISAQGLSQPAGSFSTPAPTDGAVATEEELRVAAAMGLTEADYMSGRVQK